MSNGKSITMRLVALPVVLALALPLTQLRSLGNTSQEEKSESRQTIGTIDLDWLVAHDPECKKQVEVFETSLKSKLASLKQTCATLTAKAADSNSSNDYYIREAYSLRRDHDCMKEALKLHLRERLKELFKTTPFSMPIFYSDAVIAGNTVDMSEKALALLSEKQAPALHSGLKSDLPFISYDASAVYHGLSDRLTQSEKIKQLGIALDNLRALNKKKIADAKAQGLAGENLKNLEVKYQEEETSILLEESDLIQSTTSNIRARVTETLPELLGEAKYIVASDITPMPIQSLDQDLIKMIDEGETKLSKTDFSAKTLQNPLQIDTIDMSILTNSKSYYKLSESERMAKLKELAAAELARRGDNLLLELENCKLGGTDITASIISKFESAQQQSPDYAELFFRQCPREVADGNSTSVPTWTVYAPALPIFYLSGASSGFILPRNTAGNKSTEAEKQEQYYRGELNELSSFVEYAQAEFGQDSPIVALYLNARGLRALKHNQFLQAKLDFASAISVESKCHETDAKVLKDLMSMGPFFEHRNLYEGRGKGGIQAFESQLNKDYWNKPGAPKLDSSIYSAEVRVAGYFHNFNLVRDKCKTKHSYAEESVDKAMRNYKEGTAPILTKI